MAMMKVTMRVAVAMMVALAVAVAAAESAGGMTCGTVVQFLTPCFPYVTGQGPMGRCCSGIQGLYARANNTPDRQAVCNCLKSLARTTVVNMNKAATLPKTCGLNIPYQISPATNCARVR